MWRYVLAFVVAASAAEAGQVRSSFQVGVTITGPTKAAAPAQRQLQMGVVPLPRPRPADSSALAGANASGTR